MIKQKFMAVSGMNRMAYNDQYIIGQKAADEFILYKFGEMKLLGAFTILN